MPIFKNMVMANVCSRKFKVPIFSHYQILIHQHQMFTLSNPASWYEISIKAKHILCSVCVFTGQEITDQFNLLKLASMHEKTNAPNSKH